MSFQIEREWTTEAGLKAVAAIVNSSHRCGYVGITSEHPLHGKEYRWHLPIELWNELEARDVPFRGSPIDMLLAAGDRQENTGPQISYYFYVHGGITYSRASNDNLKLDDGWWFGFDCAHYGDARFDEADEPGAVVRSLKYVEQECESLAKQLARAKGGTP